MINILNSVIFYVNQYSYFAVFIFLFSLAFALPISEEVALLIVGYITKKGIVKFPYSLIVAFLGILSGDLLMFYAAKFLGVWIFKLKIFSKIFKKEKIDDGINYIAKNGPKIIFFSRFVMGVRATMILAAGFLKMKIKDFILYDFLASLISIPILVFSGFFLGKHLDKGVSITHKIEILLLFLFFIVLLILVIKKLWKKRV